MTEIYPGMEVDRRILVTCRLCRNSYLYYSDGGSVQSFVAALRDNGWIIGKKGCVCPRCKEVRE